MDDNDSRILLGLATGLTLQLLGVILAIVQGTMQYSLLLLILGQLIFTLGCTGFASKRGYPWWLGFSGIAGVFGLFVLLSLPRPASTPAH